MSSNNGDTPITSDGHDPMAPENAPPGFDLPTVDNSVNHSQEISSRPKKPSFTEGPPEPTSTEPTSTEPTSPIAPATCPLTEQDLKSNAQSPSNISDKPFPESDSPSLRNCAVSSPSTDGCESPSESEADDDSQCSEHSEEPEDIQEGMLKWADGLIEDDDDFESITEKSPSQTEWSRQKRDENQKNEYLDRIMSMVGHEHVKAYFLSVKEKVDISRRWNKSLGDWSFDLVLHGNDGTGKRKIAQLYAEFLHSIGVVSERKFVIQESDDPVDMKVNKKATVAFFAKADAIVCPCCFPGIINDSETDETRTVFILSHRRLTDRSRQALNASHKLRDWFSNYLKLENYDEKDTFELIRRLCKGKPGFGAEVNGLLHILSRRISRLGVKEADEFKNVHSLAEEIERICGRWKKRTAEAWLNWAKLNSPQDGTEFGSEISNQDSLILEDVLGPEPKDFRENSLSWKEIQKLVGLREVKEGIENIIDLAEANYQHELHGQKPLSISLNRCFLGAPGVGKTTVATLYPDILAELGILSKGHITTKKASDLIGSHVGDSEAKVTQALEDSKGGVLVIDDAHILYHETSNHNNDSDPFRQGVLDTLVANVSGSPGEDRCVILCGYADEMERMLLKSNPGLARRFPLETALTFASYNTGELYQILEQRMEEENIVASDEAQKVARDMLSRMRRRPNFGNGGDVETLLSQAKLRRTRRLKGSMVDIPTQPLEPIDFDPDFDRPVRAEKNRNALFEGFVGFKQITDRFQSYQKMTDGMRRYGIDPKLYIPWAFIFKGPSGTGKTSTAQKVGKMYYDMGLLSSDEVVTCSVTNLIGEYVGHTGPKVLNQFELGLGKVLFIDEAYRLVGDRFQKEAIGELVDAMTNPRYVQNMVVILAGYNNEMDSLLRSNPGLRSRFPTVLEFPQMSPEDSLQLLTRLLSKLNITFSKSITDRGGRQNDIILNLLMRLCNSKGWASGRDVEALSRVIIEFIFTREGESEDLPGSEGLDLSFVDLMSCLKGMLEDRGVVLPYVWDEDGNKEYVSREVGVGNVVPS